MEKILHITKRYPPYIGGIETVCRDMAIALKGHYEQLVLAFNDKSETVKEGVDGVPVVRAGVQKVIASQPLSKDYKKCVYEALRDFKPDIIHFDYPNPYAAFFLLKAMRKFHFSGKFYLFWHMDIVKQKVLRLFFGPQTKKLIKRADRIICTSPNYLVGTSYLPDVKGKDIRVIPLCVAKERLAITSEQKAAAKALKEKYKGKKIVFFFGRHVPYKGLEYLIEANNLIDQEKVQLLIAGSGPLTKELKEKASSMKNIEFIGRLPDEDINTYLLACDIFAFPSITRNEAFGISLAEALSFGKPAVTFTIPGSGVNYVSVHEETGLEAPNRDSKALADNIMKLVGDEDLYAKLAKGAKQRALNLFMPEQFGENILKSMAF